MNKTNSVLKDSIINVSRNFKNKDISINSKQNNSFESSKFKKEESTNNHNKRKNNKISNFQKYIKNVIKF